MEIGKKIKRYRLLNDLTQQELADKLFVQRQTISNWETGKTIPRENERAALDEFFDTTFNHSENDVNESLNNNTEQSNNPSEKTRVEPHEEKPDSSFERNNAPQEKDSSVLFLILSIIAVVFFPIGPFLAIYVLVKNKKHYSLYLANNSIAVFAFLISLYFLLSMIFGILAWVAYL